MKLFSDKKRTDITPKKLSESIFEYLDRSCGRISENARLFLNECLSSYPKKDSKDIVGRLKKNNSDVNQAACFELILFYIFKKLEFKIEVHPNLKNKSPDHPDFLVTDKENRQFYLEAISTSDLKSDFIQQKKILQKFIQDLDRKLHSKYLLTVKVECLPTSQPNSKNATKELQVWLDNEKSSTWEYENNQCKLLFKKDIEKNDPEKYSSFISIQYPVMELNPKAIKNATKKKRKKYGKPDKPLILAVNLTDFYSEGNIIENLLGEIKIKHTMMPEGIKSEEFIDKNGVFLDPSSKIISSVWAFKNIHPFQLTTDNAIFINPYANYETPISLKNMFRYYDFVYQQCGNKQNILNDIFSEYT